MRRILSRVGSGYRAGGTILLNCIVFFVLATSPSLAFPDPTPDPFDPESHRNGWVQQHGIETMRRVYPGRSDAEIERLVRNTGRFGQLFEPYIHTKSEPMVLSYLSFHEAGFRLVGRDQGPWPMSSKAVNIFTFGGSTTAGSGVSDGETFAAVLQGQLRQALRDEEHQRLQFRHGRALLHAGSGSILSSC